MKNGIPVEGVHGAADIRLTEASSTEFRQVAQLLQAAVQNEWRARLGKLPADYISVYVESIFPDRVIVNYEGRYWSHGWSLDESNQVKLAAPVEVVEQYVPVAMREADETDAFLESVNDEGTIWDVVIIRAGLSKNATFYPDAVLREAAPLFEGARVFAKADAEHIKGEGKSIHKLAGWISGAKFIEGAKADTGRLTGRLNISAAEERLRKFLVDAHKRGMKGIAGLSIDADGSAVSVMREGKKVRQAKTISKVHSVDVIVDPAAGGEIVRLVESVEESRDMKLREKMEAKIKSNATTAAKYPEPGKLDDDALDAAYREALVLDAPPAAAAAPVKEKDAPAPVTTEDLRMVEAKINGRTKIATCGLPAPAIHRLQTQFETRARFTEAEVDQAIHDERDYLAKYTESGHVVLPLEGARAEDRSKQMADMLDAFFDPKHADHGKVFSFKECYVEITGDKHVTGQIANCDRARMAESMGAFRESLDSGSWANVLGNSITRAMVREYRAAVEYDMWRQIVSVVPVTDFRSQERVRIGGYGDLPTVAQGQPYAALASPTDEKSTYAIAKKGGTEDITLEMIKNDDIGSIARIPQKLGRAAKRTLSKFVFDFIRNNAAIYDGDAFFHANHNNLFTTALDGPQLAIHRLAMMKQTELSSVDRVGIPPKFLAVPVDLEEISVNLFNRNTNNDKTFIQTLSMTILPVWYWTDANDWATVADPMDIDGIEVGFLDNQQEPQLFVQDNPTVGSMFSHDKLTYKLRHIYGGAVKDFRCATKAVVA